MSFKDSQLVASYGSIVEAHEKTGISQTAINSNLLGYSKTSGGFVWKYRGGGIL